MAETLRLADDFWRWCSWSMIGPMDTSDTPGKLSYAVDMRATSSNSSTALQADLPPAYVEIQQLEDDLARLDKELRLLGVACDQQRGRLLNVMTTGDEYPMDDDPWKPIEIAACSGGSPLENRLRGVRDVVAGLTNALHDISQHVSDTTARLRV